MNLYSKKIFYIHLGVAIFYTCAGFFVFGSAFLNGNVFSGMTRNETIFWLWILYVIVITLLPFTFTLSKINK